MPIIAPVIGIQRGLAAKWNRTQARGKRTKDGANFTGWVVDTFQSEICIRGKVSQVAFPGDSFYVRLIGHFEEAVLFARLESFDQVMLHELNTRTYGSARYVSIAEQTFYFRIMEEPQYAEGEEPVVYATDSVFCEMLSVTGDAIGEVEVRAVSEHLIVVETTLALNVDDLYRVVITEPGATIGFEVKVAESSQLEDGSAYQVRLDVSQIDRVDRMYWQKYMKRMDWAHKSRWARAM